MIIELNVKYIRPFKFYGNGTLDGRIGKEEEEKLKESNNHHYKN